VVRGCGKKARDFWEDFLFGENIGLLSGLEAEMGAGAEVMHQVVPLLEPPFHRCVVKSVDVMEEVVAVAPGQVQPATSPKAVVEVAVEVPDLVSFRFQLSKSFGFFFCSLINVVVWSNFTWITEGNYISCSICGLCFLEYDNMVNCRN
jgi:hypothetical protein